MIDKQQFTQEAEALLPTLHRIAQGILRNEADAQDAVQQALLKAWEKRDTVRPDSFRPWLSRIVVNGCRDIQRRRLRVTPVDAVPDKPFFERAYDPPDPALTQAIFSLKETLRIPLLLRYMEEYSIPEVARILGLPASMVKNRLFRARRVLQKNISQLREDERV